MLLNISPDVPHIKKSIRYENPYQKIHPLRYAAHLMQIDELLLKF